MQPFSSIPTAIVLKSDLSVQLFRKKKKIVLAVPTFVKIYLRLTVLCIKIVFHALLTITSMKIKKKEIFIKFNVSHIIYPVNCAFVSETRTVALRIYSSGKLH